MQKQYNVLLISLIILALTIFSLSACGGNPEKPSPENKPPEVPEILTEMEDTILSTMYTIDSIKGVEEGVKEIENLKKEITAESEVDQKKEEKEDSAKGMIDLEMMIEKNSIIIPVLKAEEVEDEIIQTEKPPKDSAEIWYKIQGSIYQIHRQWNVLETHLQDAKITKTEVEKFEELMEEATEHVDKENVEESLIAFNELLGYLAEYKNHFHSKVPFEIYRLKYHTRKTVLLAYLGKFQEALTETEKSKELADGMRQDLIEKQEEGVIQKFDLSIEDLQHQIQDENFHLVQLKSAIVMKNLELMIAPFESSN